MKSMKRLCALLLTVCMMLACVPAVSAANGTIVMNLNANTMQVNGVSTQIDSDASIKPQVKKINGKGYTMLPLRAIVEAMGGTVAYDASTKVITMTYGGTTVKHTIGTGTATVNGVSKSTTIKSYAENNRTYVYLRTIELLSSSIKVNWTQANPNQVSITYPASTAGTSTVALTIKNAAYGNLVFKSLQMAPAGTTSYSGNLLSSTLYQGGTVTVNVSLKSGKYDMKGIDMNGNTFNWKGLDFTNIKSNAKLTLTSGAMFTLVLDNALQGDLTANVTVLNQTNAQINNIKVYPAGSSAASAATISSDTTAPNGSVRFSMPYYANAPYYYMVVTYYNGNTQTFGQMNLGGANVTVALRGDGSFTYGSQSSSSSVAFVNNSGSSMKYLQMKVGSNGSWSENLLTGTLRSGDYIYLSNYSASDLRGKTVYFRYSTSSNAPSGNGKNVTTTSSSKSTMVFSYGSSLSVAYNVKPKDVLAEEGLYIENISGKDIDYVRVLNYDIMSDDFTNSELEKIGDKYFTDIDTKTFKYDASDYYEEISNLDDDEIEYVSEWDHDDLKSATLIFEVVFDGSKTKHVSSVDVKRSGWDTNVKVTISSTGKVKIDDYDVDSSGSASSSGDLETGLIFSNESGAKIDTIYVKVDNSKTELTKKSSFKSADEVITSLKDGKYEVADGFEKYRDIEDQYIHYYIVFDSTSKSDQYGTFEVTKSNKDNVCVVVKSTNAKTDWKYDWDDGSSSTSDDETVYFQNDTGKTIEEVEMKIGSGGSYETVYSKNISKGKQAELNYTKVDDLSDLSDFDDQKVYIRVTYNDGQTKKDSVTVKYKKDYTDLTFTMDSDFDLTYKFSK